MERIAVVGAGLMGHGIAQVFALAGHTVRVHDVSADALASLRERIGRIPYLDPIDLRFRARTQVAVPSSQAVMFCVMDVSGSMDQARKDLAKRFFILLYLFLTRHYEKIDLVFIRHHTQAAEVSEEQFFHSTESGARW